MASAAKTAARTMKESQDVVLAEEGVEAVQQQIAALNAEFQDAVDGLERQPDAAAVPLETVSIKPKKAQIAVQKVLLAWTPRA
jgi:ribosomal protein S12